VLLVGVLEGLDDPAHPVNNAKIGTKLVLVLVITVLAWINRRKAQIPGSLYVALLVLAVAEVGIAVFW